MHSGPKCAVLCCLAVLAAPSAASGAVRYAAPGASGGEPCNPAPCSIQQAVNFAGGGDRVILAPGKYAATPELELKSAIDVGPEPGSGASVIEFGFEAVRVKHPNAVLHDVRIEMPGPAMALPLHLEAGTVERVYSVSGELTGGGCAVEGGLLRDSVCGGGIASGLNVGSGEPGTVHIDLRNVTTTSTHFFSSGADVSVTAVNLITYGLPGVADLYVDVNTGSSGTITLSHSNYDTVDTSLSAGTNYSYTQPGTNGNQTAEPLFVNAAAADFHQLPGSPTIDAGVSDPLLGTADPDGKPRAQPPCIGGTPTPDIGAYENASTSACPKPSSRFKFGKLKRNKKKGTAKLSVSLPGPGKVSLSGKGVVGRTLSGSGTVKLLIKAKGKRKRTLERTGKVKLKAKITFTPTGGDPNTQVKTVKLIKKLPGSGG